MSNFDNTIIYNKKNNIQQYFDKSNGTYHQGHQDKLSYLDIQGLQQIDLFGYPVTLLTGQSNTHTTKLSGFISTFLILILFIIYKDGVFQYFTKQNVNSSVSQIFNSNPAEMVMTKDNFMFAISFSQTDYIFNERPYFNVTLSQKSQMRDNFGNKTKVQTQIAMEPCRLEKFQKIFGAYGQNFTDQYHQLQFDQWLCPTDDYEIRLAGSVSNNIYEYMKIEISQCFNDTSSNSNLKEVNSGFWNPICAPKDSLLNHSKFGFSIYTTNYVVNIQDPSSSFITPFLSDELHFNFSPQKLFKSVDIYFREQDVTTDDDIFYGNLYNTNTLIYKEYQDYNEIIDVPRNDTYSEFYFHRSYLTITSQRNYQKFTDLISYLGGFTAILLPLFSAFLQAYNRYDFIIYLANKIYNFDLNGEGVKQTTPFVDQESINQSTTSQPKLTNQQAFQGLDSNLKSSSFHDIKENIIQEDKLFNTLQFEQSCREIDKTKPSQVIMNQTDFVDENSTVINNELLKKPVQQSIFVDSKNETKLKKKSLKFKVFDGSQEIKDTEELQKIKQKQSYFFPPLNEGANLFKKVKGKIFGLSLLKKNQQAVVLKNAFKEVFQNMKKIEYNLKWVINSFTFGHLYNTHYTKLINKAIELIYFDLDVLTMIRNNQDLIKLKTVILQEQQLLLINVQEKNLIKIESEDTFNLDSLKHMATKSIAKNIEPQYFQIQEAYQYCLEARDMPEQFQYNVNNKLIEALGIELRQNLALIS